MDQAVRGPSFGHQLRRWRGQRGLTQLALAHDAQVSARHLSWLESDKSTPSRAMVLRLADKLDVPLRERNTLLAAAGYAPLYAERSFADPALAPAREVLQRLLDAHEPAPALAVDRHWNLVAANRMVGLFTQGVAAHLLGPPLNVLRLSLHPEGLAPLIDNAAAWREHVLARLARQAHASGDIELAALHRELAAYPLREGADGGTPLAPDAVAVPLVLNTPHGRLSFITTITVFGAPHDLLLSELAVETLLPADAPTAAALRRLLDSAPAAPAPNP
jgi:transcriptional regulator with XRE-family HTH domain